VALEELVGGCIGALRGFCGPTALRDPAGANGNAIGLRRALEELLWALEGLLEVLGGLRGVLWGALRSVGLLKELVGGLRGLAM